MRGYRVNGAVEAAAHGRFRSKTRQAFGARAGENRTRGESDARREPGVESGASRAGPNAVGRGKRHPPWRRGSWLTRRCRDSAVFKEPGGGCWVAVVVAAAAVLVAVMVVVGR